jgi:hypothetical protein
MIGDTNRGQPTRFLIGLLTVAIVILSVSGCKGDKNRRGDPGALPPLGSKGEESARVSGKNLVESLAFYKKSLVVLLRLYGEANAEVAATYEKMARVYQEQGDRAGTVEYYGKALKSLRSVYRMDHPAVLQTLKNSADAYMDVGDPRSAIGFYNEFQLTGANIYGPTHEEMLESYEKMGDAFVATGQPLEALKHYQHWARYVQKSPSMGRRHPEMARAYNKLADIYYKMGKVPEAEKLKDEAVGIMYPSIGSVAGILRPRFFVSMRSKDLKRNRAKVSYPDRATIDFGSRLMGLPSKRAVRVVPIPVVDEHDIINVEMARVQQGKGLLFYLTAEGAQRLSQLSRDAAGLSLILEINGNAIGERRIDGEIQDGQLFTFVEIPDELLDKMVISLKETCRQLNGGTQRQSGGS